MASKFNHLGLIEQNGPVMADRVGIEDALEKGLTQKAIQGRSTFQVPIKTFFSLEYDQGPNPLPGEGHNGLGDYLNIMTDKSSSKSYFVFGMLK